MGSGGIFMHIFWFCSSSSTLPFLIPLFTPAGPCVPPVEVPLYDTYILLLLHLLGAGLYWRTTDRVFGCSALLGDVYIPLFSCLKLYTQVVGHKGGLNGDQHKLYLISAMIHSF